MALFYSEFNSIMNQLKILLKDDSQKWVFVHMKIQGYNNKSDKNEKLSEKMSEKTSEKIIKYISENAHITIAELSSNIGVTGRTIERNINKLQKESRLKRSGGDRAGKWEILKD